MSRCPASAVRVGRLDPRDVEAIAQRVAELVLEAERPEPWLDTLDSAARVQAAHEGTLSWRPAGRSTLLRRAGR